MTNTYDFRVSPGIKARIKAREGAPTETIRQGIDDLPALVAAGKVDVSPRDSERLVKISLRISEQQLAIVDQVAADSGLNRYRVMVRLLEHLAA